MEKIAVVKKTAIVKKTVTVERSMTIKGATTVKRSVATEELTKPLLEKTIELMAEETTKIMTEGSTMMIAIFTPPDQECLHHPRNSDLESLFKKFCSMMTDEQKQKK